MCVYVFQQLHTKKKQCSVQETLLYITTKISHLAVTLQFLISLYFSL